MAGLPELLRRLTDEPGFGDRLRADLDATIAGYVLDDSERIRLLAVLGDGPRFDAFFTTPEDTTDEH